MIYCDVIILGLGAIGSACAWQCSQQGLNVIGFDQFHPPHQKGSSHGLSRIIREAYFEHPDYVPLLQRSYELWRDLEKASSSVLLQITGGLMIGPEQGELVQGSLKSAHLHQLPHHYYDQASLQKKWPGFQLPQHYQGVHEPRAGWLTPESCIQSSLQLAEQNGAQLFFNTPLTHWKIHPDGILVESPNGSVIGQKLVISAGAWLPELLQVPAQPLTVSRQVLYWFQPLQPDLFRPERFPVFLLEHAPGQILYGFPDTGQGVKVALHTPGETLHPDDLSHSPLYPTELAEMQRLIQSWLPEAAGSLQQHAVCMYTNTADQHFWLDSHPHYDQILIMSPCSGHGFKFASVLGEGAAQWAQSNDIPADWKLFQTHRKAHI